MGFSFDVVKISNPTFHQTVLNNIKLFRCILVSERFIRSTFQNKSDVTRDNACIPNIDQTLSSEAWFLVIVLGEFWASQSAENEHGTSTDLPASHLDKSFDVTSSSFSGSQSDNNNDVTATEISTSQSGNSFDVASGNFTTSLSISLIDDKVIYGHEASIAPLVGTTNDLVETSRRVVSTPDSSTETIGMNRDGKARSGRRKFHESKHQFSDEQEESSREKKILALGGNDYFSEFEAADGINTDVQYHRPDSLWLFC